MWRIHHLNFRGTKTFFLALIVVVVVVAVDPDDDGVAVFGLAVVVSVRTLLRDDHRSLGETRKQRQRSVQSRTHTPEIRNLSYLYGLKQALTECESILKRSLKLFLQVTI